MEGIKQFFESSTIHGLYHISSATRLAKVFWLIIVFGGFSGAGILIYESFNNWQQSPISTTIETLPISQITLPNLTVCPPKNSFLNLNYDLLNSNQLKLDNDTRYCQARVQAMARSNSTQLSNSISHLRFKRPGPEMTL